LENFFIKEEICPNQVLFSHLKEGDKCEVMNY
jgi:hypothetical protein